MIKIHSTLLSLRNIAIIGIVSLLLGGCYDNEKTHSVDWYKNNQSARDSMLKRCAAKANKLSKTDNCKNAVEATVEISRARARNSHPIS